MHVNNQVGDIGERDGLCELVRVVTVAAAKEKENGVMVMGPYQEDVI